MRVALALLSKPEQRGGQPLLGLVSVSLRLHKRDPLSADDHGHWLGGRSCQSAVDFLFFTFPADVLRKCCRCSVVMSSGPVSVCVELALSASEGSTRSGTCRQGRGKQSNDIHHYTDSSVPRAQTAICLSGAIFIEVDDILGMRGVGGPRTFMSYLLHANSLHASSSLP